MFRKTFCPDKRPCFLAGKADSTMLRGVSYLPLFAAIRRYSPLFETIRTIRYSGFPDTQTRRYLLIELITDKESIFMSIYNIDRTLRAL